MAIHSGVANRGLIRERAISASGVGIRWRQIPLLVKFAIVTLLSLVLLVMGILSAARTGVVPEINVPAEIYLPGNALPQLPKDAECVDAQYLYRSCIVHIAGQIIYLTYYASSRMIVRTAIPVREHNIGELIIAWGSPSGITQDGDSVFVYWGKRCAILYTRSFRPESPLEFVQYDFQEQPASAWLGFKLFEKTSPFVKATVIQIGQGGGLLFY